MMVALTEKRIAKLLREGIEGRFRDTAGPVVGVHLQIRKGAKGVNASWLLRYQVAHRDHWHGLGAFPLVSLKAARERAREARLKLLDSVDPIQAKKDSKAAKALEAAKSITFAEAAKQYYESHEAKWSAKHASQWRASVDRFVIPKIGNLSVGAVDVGLVLKCIEPHWRDKTETMARVRNRIEAVLDWASVRKYRTGENPARWTKHLEHLLPARADIAKPENFESMPYAELPTFLTKLRQQEGTTARALEYLILTAARAGDVIGAVWSEVDLLKKVWVIPAERMKADREHRVPLSDAALDLLQALPREDGNPYLFIGARKSGISPEVMRRLLRRMGVIGFTVHGFRASFSTWASERTSFPNDIIELSLAHAVGNGVERAYKRTDLADKRRRLLEQWASYCTSPAATEGTVIALRKA